MAEQSPMNLCRSLERLLPMMMMLSPGRASLFIIIWCPDGLFLRCSSDSDPSPAQAHVSETSPGPSTSRDPANSEEITLSPSNDAHMLLWCQLHAPRLDPPPPKIVVACQHGNHHQLLKIPHVPSKGCIASSI
jgi:hypothetical protein